MLDFVNVPMNMCVVSKQGTSHMNFSVLRGPNVVIALSLFVFHLLVPL